jgi:hypothetical protein
MGDCYDAAEYGYDYWDEESLYETVEARCWQDGFNGTCDSFARSHEACGGEIPADSAAECTEWCESTTGAHIDDLDTICGYDSDCEDYCDVDIQKGGEACGGLSEANLPCIHEYFDRIEAWMCEDALAEALDNG